LSFLSDITLRKQAEEALRESEEKYRRLVDNANEAILVTQDGRLKFVNHMALDLTGYSEQELLSAPFVEFIHPDDQGLVMERHLRRLQGDVSESKYEFRLITRGGVKWVDIGTVLIDWAGRPAALSFLSDITARKQAEFQREMALEALRESEERLAHIIDFLPDATLVIDRKGKVIAWNRAIEEMTGVSKNEIVGQTGFAHAVPFYGKTRPILIDLIFRDQDEVEKEYDFVSKQGDQLTAEAFAPLLYHGQGAYLWGTAAPLYDSSGHVVGAIESIRDITNSKQAEAQLRKSNAELQTRNEELDVFAHMVAHDLKNPLGAMMGYAELLTATYDTLSTEAILQTLKSIHRIGRKTGSIIESLFVLASVRKQDVQVVLLDMACIIDEVVLRLADAIQDRGADLHMPDRADWPVALGHAPWIEEIWVNYLSNAIKYGGPRPRIDLGAARLPPLSAGEDQGGGFICFSVRDYGPGLTPEQQERLFAPFERLGQAQVEGHGLGLSVVRRIAEKLGGHVGVDSAPGQGSTFYFTLPAAPDPKP
jgi:PAS domain S-box-containing protein